MKSCQKQVRKCLSLSLVIRGTKALSHLEKTNMLLEAWNDSQL